MDFPEFFTLNNGWKIPAVGLGTFQSDAGNSNVRDAVKLALKLGYKHIDGANAYGNEKEIGEAIRESGIPRDEIFVTSKLYVRSDHAPCSVSFCAAINNLSWINESPLPVLKVGTILTTLQGPLKSVSATCS
jgi:diketogulonate reductase-like aldo/keto reductase